MNLKSAAALLLITNALTLAETKVSFDETNVLSKSWESGITGKGAAKWEVVSDDTAPSSPNVLKQSGEGTYCWAAKTDEKIKDGFAEVKFKPLSGKKDQAAGIVFRFTDGNNYYIVRANALEENVVLYKMVNGKRSSLPVKGRASGYGVDAKVPGSKWSTLRVEFHRNLLTVSLNGEKLFDVEDDTFKEAGAVGVLTKADSVTLFDDFSFGSK